MEAHDMMHINDVYECIYMTVDIFCRALIVQNPHGLRFELYGSATLGTVGE